MVWCCQWGEAAISVDSAAHGDEEQAEEGVEVAAAISGETLPNVVNGVSA